jgi:methylthioribose-1-phosphate isomerase
VKTLWWEDNALLMIDQTKLPMEEEVVLCRDHRAVARAIVEMRVRGAPAIGVAAAYGVALAAAQAQGSAPEIVSAVSAAIEELRATRPTAVNLFWALDRMARAAAQTANFSPDEVRSGLLEEAHRMAEEDERTNRLIGAHGSELVRDGDTILTHCNAGALATVAYGTALGVVRAAHEQGKVIHVLADETRPFLQGARLTTWELQRDGIPVTLITDNMAGHYLKSRVNLVVVGADRIASNGDTANKIGTYGVAVIARENGVPFYIAAPLSTIDRNLGNGDAIPIEERNPDEVTSLGGVRIAPLGVRAAHPAFDVTPARYISGIITEVGVLRPPYERSIASAFASRAAEGWNEQLNSGRRLRRVGRHRNAIRSRS